MGSVNSGFSGTTTGYQPAMRFANATSPAEQPQTANPSSKPQPTAPTPTPPNTPAGASGSMFAPQPATTTAIASTPAATQPSAQPTASQSQPTVPASDSPDKPGSKDPNIETYVPSSAPWHEPIAWFVNNNPGLFVLAMPLLAASALFGGTPLLGGALLIGGSFSGERILEAIKGKDLRIAPSVPQKQPDVPQPSAPQAMALDVVS